MPTQRIPRGFQDAVDAIEQLLKKSSSSSVSCSCTDKIFGHDLEMCLAVECASD